MKTRNLVTSSVTALSIALGAPMSAQEASQLPPGQMQKLMGALQAMCAAEGDVPPALDCNLVAEASQDGSREGAVVDMAEDLAANGVAVPGVDLNQLLATGAPAEAADVAAAPDVAAEPDVAAGAEATASAEADAQAPAPADQPAEAQAQAEGNADSAVQADDLAAALQEQADTEANAAPEAAPEAEAETQAEVQQTAPEAEAQAEAEQAAPAPEAEAQAEAEQATPVGPAPEAETQAEAEQAAPAPEAEAQAEATGEVQADDLAAALEAEAQQAEDNAAAAVEQAEGAAEEAVQDAQDGVAEAQTEAEQALEQQAEAVVGEENIPTEADAQAQADAVAESEQSASAAAAASAEGGTEEPEAVQETVTEENTRQSDEDFTTTVNQSQAEAERYKQEARDAGEDAERARTVAGAALLGLGAVALNNILDNNDNVVSNSGDRVVVENNGRFRVLRNDDVLLRRPGAEVTTYQYNDGSTRNVVAYDDGTSVETVRAADGRVLRRTRILTDGSRVILFDDTQQAQEVVVGDLPQVSSRGNEERTIYREGTDAATLEQALASQVAPQVGRTFSLNQIRNIDRVRQLVPEVSVDTINFETNSAAIRPDEAQELAALGNALKAFIDKNPSEVFLIEGHTDAVGNYAYNLALSDRRAESVALALTEYFKVPPENMVLQGYGESDLLVPTADAERANRRAAVRRITPLLQNGG
ncbi:OmpA family protein [Sagittula stellata]|uniref:Outer membrane protein, OmpA/MotB family n=1 Tax=Sagittula stellata (strain ATCC 700073 / DSM 11524 / E-37) TaxID=388399 RepID=A3JYV5_SAGS3|nr:OmpA family protein [Sagittula stellata]EBA09658.1 Outer membrane protein, OmpA/MotB family [Sagittula stellata E-37]